MPDLLDLFIVGATASIFLGRKEVPLVARFVGNAVGRVVGAVQGARLRIAEMSTDSELGQLGQEIRSNLEDIDVIKNELRYVKRWYIAPLLRSQETLRTASSCFLPELQFHVFCHSASGLRAPSAQDSASERRFEACHTQEVHHGQSIPAAWTQRAFAEPLGPASPQWRAKPAAAISLPHLRQPKRHEELPPWETRQANRGERQPSRPAAAVSMVSTIPAVAAAPLPDQHSAAAAMASVRLSDQLLAALLRRLRRRLALFRLKAAAGPRHLQLPLREPRPH
ncbi:unnamed protein product [Phaeothamnion confervicola]